MNHIVLLAQFNERLEHIDKNRKLIYSIHAVTEDVAQLEKLTESLEQLDAIEADVKMYMEAFAALN